MGLKFSERLGITKKTDILVKGRIPIRLRNSIWNYLLSAILHPGRHSPNSIKDHVRFLFEGFFKYPIDTLPESGIECRKNLRNVFMSPTFQWYEIYNLIEFIVKNCESFDSYTSKKFISDFNSILEEENSGYRFIEDRLVSITDPDEIQNINSGLSSIQDGKYVDVKKHLNSALELLSKRPEPDFINSIKHSMRALDTFSKIFTGEKNGDLEKAMTKLDEKVRFNEDFKTGLLSLYGYTKDDKGISHPILSTPHVGLDEAKFMLMTCSALVNFLISRSS